MLYQLADDVQFSFKGRRVGDGFSAPDEYLLEGRLAFQGRGTQQGIIGRHGAPTQHGLAFFSDDALKDLPAFL